MSSPTIEDFDFKNKQPAIFIDRDGVINKDHGYVCRIDDFHFINGVIAACKKLKEKGYLLVVITNQSGIARGYYTEAQFNLLTQWMDWSFANEGVELDGIYYCPHHFQEGIGQYKIDCDCRKPKPGLIVNAVADLNLDLSRSILVGDTVTDIQAGISAGIKENYLVRTGKKITDEGVNIANAVFDDLSAFSEHVTPIL